MRTLKNLPVPQDGNDNLFPYGQIKNQTATETGTPVVREIYGDILTNIYKIIRDSGIEFNQLEDSETNGYQLLKALKVFANEINDLSQVITVGSNTLEVNFDFDNLPNDYIFIAKPSDSISKNTLYEFTGTGNSGKTMTASIYIPANSLILVTLKESTIEIELLKGSAIDLGLISTPYDGVLSFNSTDETYYLFNERLMTNKPISENIGQAVRVYSSNNDFIVVDAVVHKDKLIAMSKNVNDVVYYFYVFNLTDLTTPVQRMEWLGQDGSTDFNPLLYADDDFLYLSNSGNSDANDYKLHRKQFDPTDNSLSAGITVITLNSNFQATSNAYIQNDSIFTLVNGNLYEYPFTGGTQNFVKFFNNLIGQVFIQNGNVYYTAGETAVLWNP